MDRMYWIQYSRGMEAAALVRHVLERSGLSKSRLSTVSGVSRALLDDYLHGRRNPSMAQVQRLAEAAGLSLEISLRPRPRPVPASFVAVLEFGDLFPRKPKPEPVPLREVWRRAS